MNIKKIPAGKNIPHEFYVIVEISKKGPPIKYEHDKESGALFVDRFINTPMWYPMDYGYIPHTLSEDGDPVDVLIYAPEKLQPGVVIPCRAIGMLKMEDESGWDFKIIAVPIEKICTVYKNIQALTDLPELLRAQVVHFFEHYKDLEQDKWVKVHGWADKEQAHNVILSAINAAANTPTLS